MKCEQLELMKVIEFPKNRHVESKLKNDKLQVAIRFLEVLSESNVDFNILLDRKAALELFDANEELRDYLIISTSEKFKPIKLDNNCSLYTIKGNELD